MDSSPESSSSSTCTPPSSEEEVATQYVGTNMKCAPVENQPEEEQQFQSPRNFGSPEPASPLLDDAAAKRKRRVEAQDADASPRKLAKRDLLPHRTDGPAPSCLRQASSPRSGMRVTYADQTGVGDLMTEIGVQSLRNLGESLWIRNPGAIVWCDKCGRSVLQSMGFLEGAASKSQFAHHMFVCNDCSAKSQINAPPAEMPAPLPAVSNGGNAGSCWCRRRRATAS
eukprot:gnl/TRDRNA2_/TRDRNA2_193953_c0_seq1.p1 gnl/TRDRNA2_/TRDRNA2_193953_c0~~gnl/TRDRNA2_/TRDRNA2_193953_c0_seq1.p1  ORF type:complete len:226 (+),score=36.73 gnl/TRDRNA2_/TRDRNA2_193953_c0_seq1:75-752(+)